MGCAACGAFDIFRGVEEARSGADRHCAMWGHWGRTHYWRRVPGYFFSEFHTIHETGARSDAGGAKRAGMSVGGLRLIKGARSEQATALIAERMRPDARTYPAAPGVPRV